MIRVQGLAKKYQLGTPAARTDTLRDALSGLFARSRRTPRPARREEFWALRDVSFQVQRGECFGVIGRNGAGKSTLLKLLSRITAPTRGRIELGGRVASLLEVGTGFHPELTGRENVFLNGAILGMSRGEIRSKLDQIIEFAEVARFADTPVKRYSSGMYLRLAFAVAAHLEPEILVVDEVLAVGDVAFQKKCLGRMQDVARAGRTVLFVSHSMPAVQRLCQRALLLSEGQVEAEGEAVEITNRYLAQGGAEGFEWRRTRPFRGRAGFDRVYLCDAEGRPIDQVRCSQAIAVGIEYTILAGGGALQLGVGLLDGSGQEIFGSAPQDSGQPSPSEAGRYRATLHLPPEIFMPRRYGVRVALFEPHRGIIDLQDNVLTFEVAEDASLANSNPGGRQGLIAMRCRWAVEPLQEP